MSSLDGAVKNSCRRLGARLRARAAPSGVPALEATNNLSERNLRSSAQDRKANRTNKTATGAHRRSVIVSVLESLRANLEVFTLSSVLQEVQRWLAEGRSLFERQWQALLGTTATAVPDTG